jgi:hypothetical protein
MGRAVVVVTAFVCWRERGHGAPQRRPVPRRRLPTALKGTQAPDEPFLAVPAMLLAVLPATQRGSEAARAATHTVYNPQARRWQAVDAARAAGRLMGCFVVSC